MIVGSCRDVRKPAQPFVAIERLVASKWIATPTIVNSASVTLVTCPYAGGQPLTFRKGRSNLSCNILPIQLPGHSARVAEPPFESMPPLLQALAQHVVPNLCGDVALFGHSMGALIAFELARLIQAQHKLRVVHLFISGSRPPALAMLTEDLENLEAVDLIAHVARMGGIPNEVVEQPELLSLVASVLRSDLMVCKRYVYRPGDALRCPMTIYAGNDDAEATPDQMQSWSEYTERTARLRIFPGNHFFLHEYEADLCDDMRRAITTTIDEAL